MQKKTKRTWSLLGFAVLIMPVAGQSGWELGMDLQGAFPRGELRDNLSDDGIGLGIQAGFTPRGSAFTAGVRFDFIKYGDSTFRGPFDTCCFDEIEKLETSNQILMGHLFLRFQPRWRVFQPYVEGLAGIKHFRTSTSIFHEDYEEALDTHTDLDDTAWSYGCGLGIDFTLNPHAAPNHPRYQLHAGCRYLPGARASYVGEDSVSFDGTDVFFEVLESKTKLVTAEIGFKMRF